MGQIVIDLFRRDALGDRRRDQLKVNCQVCRSNWAEAPAARGRRRRPSAR
jgi:hypothetical protein